MFFFFFFFKQKTAYEMRISDWSSDVCSSDLLITQVPTFNPAENPNQVSILRLINPTAIDVSIAINGQDDEGLPAPNGALTLVLPAGSARDLTASEIENGDQALGLLNGIGNGSGKWMLTVSASQPIKVMSLLRDPGGILTNLSTSSKGT